MRAEDKLQVVVDDAWAGAIGVQFSGRLVEARGVAENGQGSAKTLYRTSRLPGVDPANRFGIILDIDYTILVSGLLGK